jgi:preprotein translocase SecE subunit
MAYKPDQGRLTRLAAFWALALLFFYGVTSGYQTLTGNLAWSARPLFEGMPRIPVLGLRLNPALLIAVVALAAVWYALYRWLNTPKIADLLIDTESEMRKVTWPSFSEAVNSSVVVIVCVVFLMGFLAGADWVLGQVSRYLLTGA